MNRLAAYNWAKVAMLVLLSVVAFPLAGAEEIAFAYLATAFGGLVVIQWLARQALPGFGGRTFMLEVWRPITATAFMSIAVLLVQGWLVDAPRLGGLSAAILAGGGVYTGAIVALWRLVGVPKGAETYLLEKMRAAYPAVRAKRD